MIKTNATTNKQTNKKENKKPETVLRIFKYEIN